MSLLGAARAVGAQTTMGRHTLVGQLDVVLFERNGRGLLRRQWRATAEAALQGSARTVDLGLRAGTGVSGTVRITASQPVACFVLPPVLAQMRLALPEVQVELVASNQVSNLLRREADIALRMVQPDQASLVVKRIGKVTLGAYAHRDYLRRRGTPRQPQDLRNHELLGGDQDEAILRGSAAMGLPLREAFAFRTEDLCHWEGVVKGWGIGFGSTTGTQRQPAGGLLPI